jgi:hypothetical protein
MLSDSDRYCALAYEDFTLSDDTHLVYSHFARTLAAVPGSAAHVLRACGSSVASLDAHVEQCAGQLRIPEAQRSSLNEVIHALARIGLLVSERDVAQKMRSCGSRDKALAPLGTVGVITRHRPDLLERGLRNLAANAQRSGRDMTVIVVCDGGEDDDAATQVVLSRLRNSFGVKTIFIGTSERRAYQHALRGQSLRDPVRFAIGREDPDAFAPGAARNLLLLRSFGERVVFIDDDAIGRFAAFGPTNELVLTDRRDPTQLRFFADRTSCLSAAQISDDIDFLGLHDQWLGKTPCCFGNLTVSLADSPTVLGRFLNDDRPARVMLTPCGVVGDSGMQGLHYLYAKDGPTRSSLHALGSQFRSYILSRYVHRFVARPTISPVGLCMTGCLGIDARRLVPPFAPQFYNEDGTFGSALRATRPDAFAVFLPVSVVHDPARHQALASFETVLARAATVRTNDALMLLLGSCAPVPSGVDPAVGMRSIGAQLVALAASETSFREVLLLAVGREREAFLATLRRGAAAVPSDAKDLLADFEHLIRAYEAALRKPADRIGIDIGCSSKDSLSCLRRYVHDYGCLLHDWPDIVATGKRVAPTG